jgi:hypothetical protein
MPETSGTYVKTVATDVGNNNSFVELRSRVVNTPASFSGDFGFKSRHGDHL